MPWMLEATVVLELVLHKRAEALILEFSCSSTDFSVSLVTNDFVTTSIATDRVSASPRPDRWDIRTLMLTAGSLASLLLVFSLSVFFMARNVLNFPLAQLQTLVIVMLVFSGQGVV